MHDVAGRLVAWLTRIISVNYDEAKCGLKEFNTTLGHLVLIGTLLSGCITLILACVFLPRPLHTSLAWAAGTALLPLLALFLLTVANLLFLVAKFPAPDLPPAWCSVLRLLSYVAVVLLVYGLMGLSLSLFSEALRARLTAPP